MSLHTAPQSDGGAELTIRLTKEEVDAIGLCEAEGLADHLDTALWGLALLRSGRTVRTPDPRPIEAADLYAVIRDLHKHLVPMAGGIRDAAIRRHREVGGSTAHLAAAMDTARSTAQDRREALDRTGPRRAEAARWETWAATPRHN
ncbi:hypothetical protein JHN53_17140 [Streptomyces sp. MBT58]|uniref:hypothetical protein n=1 Tax=Streptomyces sp. MBT58 TaxID=1488389 RepID=UPI0019128FAA|nr:hypothetical protein [Streptomyces sp. MBT58]MBK5993336.1 hypothetical protein [Streptomyces sp. MBT58]